MRLFSATVLRLDEFYLTNSHFACRIIIRGFQKGSTSGCVALHLFVDNHACALSVLMRVLVRDPESHPPAAAMECGSFYASGVCGSSLGATTSAAGYMESGYMALEQTFSHYKLDGLTTLFADHKNMLQSTGVYGPSL